MSYLIAYAATVTLFLGLDFLGLTYLIRPVFEREVGSLLLETPRYGPALVFYLFYAAGIVWFAVAPGLSGDRSLISVFANAALLGALAYGTYEFTNLATLEDWSWRLVAVDLTWGTILTGTSALGGLVVARMATSAT